MKQLITTISLILFGVIIFTIFSFQQEKDNTNIKKSKNSKIAPEVLKGVEIKLAEFTERKRKECREEAEEMAIYRIDSIMTAEAFSIKKDTIKKPGRVIKPPRPELKPIPDSIKVKPIIQKN